MPKKRLSNEALLALVCINHFVCWAVGVKIPAWILIKNSVCAFTSRCGKCKNLFVWRSLKPFLKRLLEEAQSVSEDRPAALDKGAPPATAPGMKSPEPNDFPEKPLDQLDPEEYRSLREQYVRAGKGTPPQ